VELFELIRRDHYVQGYSIRQIARQRGVHRRMVRQALTSALPAERKRPRRDPPVLTRTLRQIIDEWLQADRMAPRKQRHTGQRLYERLVKEHGFAGAAVTVQMYVSRRRRELGWSGEVFVPQAYLLRYRSTGAEAQVDWYEAAVDFPDGRRTVQFLVMRACFSGREFHQAFARQSQQAFLEGHVAAFTYFGGSVPEFAMTT
jgi:transposase